MGAVGDFFIAIGKDREKYIWKRKEEGPQTTDDSRRTTDDGPRSTVF